jgi:hypothetical protein
MHDASQSWAMRAVVRSPRISATHRRSSPPRPPMIAMVERRTQACATVCDGGYTG